MANAIRIFRELARDPHRVVTSYAVRVQDLRATVIDGSLMPKRQARVGLGFSQHVKLERAVIAGFDLANH